MDVVTQGYNSDAAMDAEVAQHFTRQPPFHGEHETRPIFNPTTLTDGYKPIRFVIPAVDNLFTDLSKCLIGATVKVIRSNGETLLSADKKLVAPANNFFDSLFERVQVKFNNTIVCDEPYHSHLAYLR